MSHALLLCADNHLASVFCHAPLVSLSDAAWPCCAGLEENQHLPAGDDGIVEPPPPLVDGECDVDNSQALTIWKGDDNQQDMPAPEDFPPVQVDHQERALAPLDGNQQLDVPHRRSLAASMVAVPKRARRAPAGEENSLAAASRASTDSVAGLTSESQIAAVMSVLAGSSRPFFFVPGNLANTACFL